MLKQNHLRIEKFLSGRDLPLVEEMRAGPFISLYGITLSDKSKSYGYKSTIFRLKAEYQQVLITQRQTELQSIVEKTKANEEVSESATDDISDVIDKLTQVTTVS